MKKVDLTKQRRSLDEVLSLARTEAVLIHSEGGEDFVLEPADAIDREAAALADNPAFASFLKARSGESGDISLARARKKRGL